MIANLLTVTLLVVSAAWTDAAAKKWEPPYAGINPNSLSCDVEGQIFLLLPHYTDCNKFYMCDHGKEVERECPFPLIFDFEVQTCNWDWDTKCWLRKSEEEIEGSGAGDGTELDWAWNEPSIAKSNVNPVPVLQLSSTLDCSKAESAARLLSYKKDCQRYWRCAKGVAETAYCTDGLFFNEAKQQCDFEANVQCDQAEEIGGEFISYK